MAKSLTERQTRAIQIPVGIIVVSAGAGTGKTTVLSETVANEMVAKNNVDIRSLLIVTFTRKAAAEMAERIGRKLRDLAQNSPDENQKRRLFEQADSVPDASIETLDAFATRLLKDHPNEAGLDPNFDVLSAERTAELGRKVARECLEKWAAAPPHEMWAETMRETSVSDWQELLYKLDSILVTRGKPSIPMILLGRGEHDAREADNLFSELERELTGQVESIREELLDSMDGLKELLIETSNATGSKGSKPGYTENAASIARTIDQVEDWLRNKTLDWDHPSADIPSSWKLWGGKFKEGAPQGESRHRCKLIIGHLAGEAKDAGCMPLRKIALDLRMLPFRKALASALVDYHNEFLRARRELNAMSFSDCEIDALRLLTENEKIRDEYHEKFRYVIVDEYQDINPLQQDLIFSLCRRPRENPSMPGNLYVVGDERQSIYGFRDADFTLLRDLRKSLSAISSPGAGSRILHENFRSRPEILSFVNHIFRALWGGSDGASDVMHTDLKPAFQPYLDEKKSSGPKIELCITQADDSSSGRRREARAVARRLNEIVINEELSILELESSGSAKSRPVRWGDCAVLIRRTAPFRLYEEAFSSLGIPYTTESGGGFWDTPEIADITSLLYCLSNTPDELSMAILLRSPWVGLSDDSLLEIAMQRRGIKEDIDLIDVKLSNSGDERKLCVFNRWFNYARSVAGRIPVDALLDQALIKSGYLERVFAIDRGRQARVNIEALLEFLRSERLMDPRVAADYLAWLRSSDVQKAQGGIPTPGDSGSVTLATVHQAKGREWPLVVLADLNARPVNSSSAEYIWDENSGIAVKRLNPHTGETESSSSFVTAIDNLTMKEESEKRRLIYVALTRAREYLILSSWLRQSENGDKWAIDRSSWLGILNETISNDHNFIEVPENFKNDVLTLMVMEPQDPDEITASAQPDQSVARVDIIRRLFRDPVKVPKAAQDKGDRTEIASVLSKKIDGIADLPVPSLQNYIVSATDIVRFDKCPRMYLYGSLNRIPSPIRDNKIKPASESVVASDDDGIVEVEAPVAETIELPASEWGTLAHKLMERVQFDAERGKIYAVASEIIADAGWDVDKYAEPLSALAQNALNLDIIQKIAPCDTMREFRLIGPVGDLRQIITGTIDLLASCDGRYIVIDYKSGKIDPQNSGRQAEYYEIQMALYAILVGSYRNIPPLNIETHIVFLDPGIDEEVKITGELMNRTIGIVDTLASDSASGRLSPEPDAQTCMWCNWHQICSFAHGIK